MNHWEKLKQHKEKLAEIKTKLELSHQEWTAYNKLFNEWLQDVLGVKDQKGEIHLSEILTKWKEANDSPSTAQG